MKKISIIIILAIVFILAAPVSAKNDQGSVCLIAESGVFVDNMHVLQGLQKAGKKLHVETMAFIAESPDEIYPALEGFVTSGECDLIIGNGFSVPYIMIEFIEGYPQQKFTVIDFEYFPKYENVSEVLFHVDQGGFLAGYLAAGLSQTGNVAVYGGTQYNRVTEFMDGYALGVEYFNQDHDPDVVVLGWDPYTQTGIFVGDYGSPELGKAQTLEFFEAGADTVFAVAGFTGLGSLEAAAEWKAAGENVRVIEPDFDWFFEHGDPARILLTSVMKKYDVAIYNTMEKFVNGVWQGGQVWEDLDSGGVDIAPFHKTSNQVPGYLRNDLKAIRQEIIDGSIQTLP